MGAYFISPYSPRTWASAVSEFRNEQTAVPRTALSRVRKLVRVGDICLCYVIGAKVFVGALEVTGAPFLDSSGGLVMSFYPVRLPTRALASVPIGKGIPLHEVRKASGEPELWRSLVRGTLKRVPERDGNFIVRQLANVGGQPSM
jgi:hypothetical protein